MRISCTLFICILYRAVFCEESPGLADFKKMLHTETALLTILNNYISQEQERLNSINRYIQLYQNQQDLALNDTEKYLANPINPFLLVKRLTTDLNELESMMYSDFGQSYLNVISELKKELTFPTDTHLTTVSCSLIKLQDTYLLETSSLARGEFNGVRYTHELSSSDCFEIGKQSYYINDFIHAKLWMTEAKERLSVEETTLNGKFKILEYLADVSYKLGDTQYAMDMTNEMLEIFPNNSTILQNKHALEAAILKDKEVNIEAPNDQELVYKQLCRGEAFSPIENASTLNCRYVTNDNPFLLLAPFKVEEAHHRPRIVIYHDVMSDNEIEAIKRLAIPLFQDATVFQHQVMKISTQARISKVAWLEEGDDKRIRDVSVRVGDMTGMVVETAENFQVVNYGVGGYYRPHTDYVDKDNVKTRFKNLETGNRIATILFYMNDVPQGGATVFPKLKVALWPKKGTAVFWYNLHPSGEGDVATEHAGCPILSGEKWIVNKWLHEHGQEFIRPCELTPN